MNPDTEALFGEAGAFYLKNGPESIKTHIKHHKILSCMSDRLLPFFGL